MSTTSRDMIHVETIHLLVSAGDFNVHPLISNLVDELQNYVRNKEFSTDKLLPKLNILRDLVNIALFQCNTVELTSIVGIAGGTSLDAGLANKIVSSICLPLLTNISSCIGDDNSNQLCCNLIHLLTSSVLDSDVELILVNLVDIVATNPAGDLGDDELETCHENQQLSVAALLGDLLFNGSQLAEAKCEASLYHWREMCVDHILHVLPTGRDRLVQRLAAGTLPLMWQALTDAQRVAKADLVWTAIRDVARDPSRDARPHMLLCALSDLLLATEDGRGAGQTGPRLLSDPDLWLVLQAGLRHHSATCRKQSIYVLKRVVDVAQTNALAFTSAGEDTQAAVFWWDADHASELATLWQEFILLMETLEESQIHIIKPLMPRLQTLIKATALRTEGTPYLHTSWLMTVFERIGHHESTLVRRWGVTELLALDYTQCPALLHQKQFFYGPFVNMLTKSSVYHKPPDVPLGDCTPIVAGLNRFFGSLPQMLEEPELADFSRCFLHGLTQQTWSGAPLMFVVQAMCHLPAMAMWDRTAFEHLKCLLAIGLGTVDVHIRAAIQCFIVELLTKLSNVDLLEPEDFAQFLGMLRCTESISRGTALWHGLVAWLRGVSTRGARWHPSLLMEYITNFIGSLLKVSNDRGAIGAQSDDSLSVVRLLLLACDADVLPWRHDGGSRRGDTFETVAWSLVDALCRGSTHAYMSPAVVDRALSFVTNLLQQSSVIRGGSESDQSQRALEKLVQDCLPNVILYIARRLPELQTLMEVDTVQLYQNALETLFELNDASLCSYNGAEVSQLVTACIETLQNVPQTATRIDQQVLRYSAMCVTASVCRAFRLPSTSSEHTRWQHQLVQFVKRMPIITSLPKPEAGAEIVASDGDCADGRRGAFSRDVAAWGQLVSRLIAAQWACVGWLVGRSESLDHAAYARRCVETLDLVADDTLLPVYGCLRSLIPHLTTECTVSVLAATWTKTKDEMKSRSFWRVYRQFVDLAFLPPHLDSRVAEPISSQLTEIAAEIMRLGSERAGLANVLTSHVSGQWLAGGRLDVPRCLLPLLVSSLLFGELPNKGRRFLDEVHHYLQSFGDKLSANQLINIDERSDCAVRVFGLGVLARLRPADPRHRDVATAVAAQLTAAHRVVSAARANHTFPNCATHRRKHRTFCALLLLQPLLDDSAGLWEFLMEVLCTEAQPSVRGQAEWLLLRLIHERRDRMADIWTALAPNTKWRGASLCSLMLIVWQTSKIVNGNEDRTAFMQRALAAVLPWCIDHHFNTKVFALATTTLLWRTCRRDGLDAVVASYAAVDLLTRPSADNSYAERSLEKLLENFVFKFHPLRDYTMETVTATLPRLAGVADDECLPPTLFLRLDPGWALATEHHVTLLDQSDELRRCQPGTWRVKVADMASEDDHEGNVQKKMVPWQVMFPVANGNEDSPSSDRKDRRAGLILVTSLVTKIPNLGGLCRTSEIFGVSEFIVGSMTHVADKGFQNLSVTADMWIPIREVKPSLLERYLTEMKQDGYTLVGAEQTARSRCLTDFRFPRKTILLLGNEKEGIPLRLLQMLDECVEIPQQGVVRSLNVHVSGALFIWEYTRQQLAQKSTN